MKVDTEIYIIFIFNQMSYLIQSASMNRSGRKCMLALSFLFSLVPLAAQPSRKGETEQRLVFIDLRPAAPDSGVFARIASEILLSEIEARHPFMILNIPRENLESDCNATPCALEIGRKQKADFVLFGSVTRLDSKYISTIRLVGTGSGRVLFTRSMTVSDLTEIEPTMKVFAELAIANVPGRNAQNPSPSDRDPYRRPVQNIHDNAESSRSGQMSKSVIANLLTILLPGAGHLYIGEKSGGFFLLGSIGLTLNFYNQWLLVRPDSIHSTERAVNFMYGAYTVSRYRDPGMDPTGAIFLLLTAVGNERIADAKRSANSKTLMSFLAPGLLSIAALIHLNIVVSDDTSIRTGFRSEIVSLPAVESRVSIPELFVSFHWRF